MEKIRVITPNLTGTNLKYLEIRRNLRINCVLNKKGYPLQTLHDRDLHSVSSNKRRRLILNNGSVSYIFEQRFFFQSQRFKVEKFCFAISNDLELKGSFS